MLEYLLECNSCPKQMWTPAPDAYRDPFTPVMPAHVGPDGLPCIGAGRTANKLDERSR
jgi:hypothetical protein